MKCTVKDVRGMYRALETLSTIPLKAAVSYRVSKFSRSIKDAAVAADEAEQKLLMEVGEPVKDSPGQFKILDGKRWVEEMTALDEEEVEVPERYRFSISDFGDAQVPGMVFTALVKFIDEEPEGVAPSPPKA